MVWLTSTPHRFFCLPGPVNQVIVLWLFELQQKSALPNPAKSFFGLTSQGQAARSISSGLLCLPRSLSWNFQSLYHSLLLLLRRSLHMLLPFQKEVWGTGNYRKNLYPNRRLCLVESQVVRLKALWAWRTVTIWVKGLLVLNSEIFFLCMTISSRHRVALSVRWRNLLVLPPILERYKTGILRLCYMLKRLLKRVLNPAIQY